MGRGAGRNLLRRARRLHDRHLAALLTSFHRCTGSRRGSGKRVRFCFKKAMQYGDLPLPSTIRRSEALPAREDRRLPGRVTTNIEFALRRNDVSLCPTRAGIASFGPFYFARAFQTRPAIPLTHSWRMYASSGPVRFRPRRAARPCRGHGGYSDQSHLNLSSSASRDHPGQLLRQAGIRRVDVQRAIDAARSRE